MSNLVGSRDYEPFRIYAREEKRPFNLGGDGPVVFGALRWAPIAEDGTVTMSAEALRDLCNHVYREGWQFGNQAGVAREACQCGHPKDHHDVSSGGYQAACRYPCDCRGWRGR